jgi:cysteine-S-conjugate beta-lyase
MALPASFFEQSLDRRSSDSAKWNYYPEDVLPMWVADMDFRSPPAVMETLRQRVDHGVFGYTMDAPALRELIVERMARLYQWTVTPEQIMFLPGIVPTLFVMGKAFGQPGQNILTTTPIYPPFLMAPGRFDLVDNPVPLALTIDGSRLAYEIDFDALEASVTPQTRMLLLCNPHNPIGRIYRRDELERLAEFCAKHDLLLISDEIHCDLILDEQPHIPAASLAPEVSARTITLMAPSKTFNLAGLGCAFAIVQNPELYQTLRDTIFGLISFVNLLGYQAATGAYAEGQEWLEGLLTYLRGNRDYLSSVVHQTLPELRLTHVEGTYLAWLDFRETGLQNPYQHLVDVGKVALSNGKDFGADGEGFLRLNFGCPRPQLEEAVARIRQALDVPETEVKASASTFSSH